MSSVLAGIGYLRVVGVVVLLVHVVVYFLSGGWLFARRYRSHVKGLVFTLVDVNGDVPVGYHHYGDYRTRSIVPGAVRV